MTLLSRDGILEADDTEYDTVPCPEWGGEVRLRSLRGAQRDDFEASLVTTNGADRKVNLKNMRAKLIVLMAVDESGGRLFSNEDIAALGRKNAKPLDRLFDACQKLAGLGEKDVERLSENFGETPDDDGSSD
jgi:hypothetical protein